MFSCCVSLTSLCKSFNHFASLLVSIDSCFVTLTSLCKSFNHFASLYDLSTPSIWVPKSFSILRHLAVHHHIFLLPDSIPFKTVSDYFATICQLISSSFLIRPKFCCNSYNALLQFFSNNTQYFYFNAGFCF